MTMTKGVESGDEEKGEEKDFSSHGLVEEGLPFLKLSLAIDCGADKSRIKCKADQGTTDNHFNFRSLDFVATFELRVATRSSDHFKGKENQNTEDKSSASWLEKCSRLFSSNPPQMSIRN